MFGGLWQTSNVIIESNDPLKGNLYLGNFLFRNHSIGNIASPKLDHLEQNKIKAVITVAKDANIKYDQSQGIAHKQINADDFYTFRLGMENIIFQNEDPYFEECIQFIEENLQKTNVLVHCFAGVSRSVTIVMAYLIKMKNMTFVEALSYVRQRRSIAYPNDGFQKQLQEFELALKKK